MPTLSESEPEASAIIQPEIVPEMEPEVAVRALVQMAADWVLGQVDPTLKLLLNRILPTFLGRMDSLTRAEAVDLINKVHLLSFELEQKTNVVNDNFE
jgi:hypothetical protein